MDKTKEMLVQVTGKGLTAEEFLTIFGLYILDHKIFSLLEVEARSNPGN